MRAKRMYTSITHTPIQIKRVEWASTMDTSSYVKTLIFAAGLVAAGAVSLLGAAAVAAQEPVVAPLDARSPLDAAAERRLPRGFGDLELGLELEQLKERLIADPSFQYRGDPEVSLVPRERQHLVETRGGPFVEHGVFQFHENRLFTITLNLNRERLDFYTLYTTLRERYGEPDRVDPSQMIWEDEEVRMSLERPLTVKYLDVPVFQQRRREAGVRDSIRRQLRHEFLELF